MFDVYDEVWIMECGRPNKYAIFAVISSMNDSRTGVDVFYRLVISRIGAGWGNDEGKMVRSNNVHSTREECINHWIELIK